MEELVTPLLFEMLRYYPETLLTLEATSDSLLKRLNRALDYTHTLIEDLWHYSARELTLKK
jgi:hypothetical protein